MDDVKASRDGNVRSAIVRYNSIRTSPQGKEMQTIQQLTIQFHQVHRSVQRLCVILPVEEQVSEVDVNEHEFFVQCNSATEN